MRPRQLVVLATVLILVMASSGCVSIHALKDALMFRDEERKVSYGLKTPSPVEYYWQSDAFLGETLNGHPENFRVKEGAKWIEIKWNVDLPTSFFGERKIFNYTIFFDPYVKMRLLTPTGEHFWERNFTGSEEDSQRFQGPGAGTWSLTIWAKGYGGAALGIDIHDQFWVVVDLFEPK